MKRDYQDYLRDMLDNAQKALEFVHGMEYDQFFEDQKSVYAVVRALEIIGEAARQVPEDVRVEHPGLHGAKLGECATSSHMNILELILKWFGVLCRRIYRP